MSPLVYSNTSQGFSLLARHRSFRLASSSKGCTSPLRLATFCSAELPDPQQTGPSKSDDHFRTRLEASWEKHNSHLARFPAAEQLSRSLSSSSVDGLKSASSSKDDSYDVDDSVTPFASGLTRNGSFDEDDIELWTYSNPSSVVFGRAGLWSDLEQVYVILFGVGQSDTEGIYSLRALSRDDGLPQDTIIAFEDPEDAERYAGLLEATMDHYPSVCPIDPQELLEFCLESGYSCRLEARGSLLIPPDYNVGITDWERSLSLREGRYSVAGGEHDGTLQEFIKHFQYVFPTCSGTPDLGSYDAPLVEKPLSGVELEDIKKRLERLLPDDN